MTIDNKPNPNMKDDNWLVEELYADVRRALSTEADMQSRYRMMWRILERMLKERTMEDAVEYCGDIPRIYALCQRHNLSHQPLSVLYSNIIRTNKGQYKPETSDLLYDAKALCQAINTFYHVPIPVDIAEQLPEQWRTFGTEAHPTAERLRFIVKEWDEAFIQGYDVDDTSQTLLRVRNDAAWQLSPMLYPLATLNLLDVTNDEDGTLHARLCILEPDYLVDITAICQCMKESGPSPLFYLLDKFMPREETLAIQLGNAANQFLDDAVHGEASFLTSMQRNFKDYPLKYCTLEGVNEDYFNQCRLQHANIHKAVRSLCPEAGIEVNRDEIMLEASFICEALGLQGRMDLLTGDLRHIVELKSGKQDDYHGTFRLEHALQMALYKEILHYSLRQSRQQVKTLLLYSRYPLLYDIRLGANHIAEAIRIRNGIVHIDRQLRTRPDDFLLSLREADFNPLASNSKLYLQYIKPRIDAFLATLHRATPLAYSYFCTMTAFLQREQVLAKIGDERPDSGRGFAQAWQASTEDKQQHGNIIADMRLTPIVDEGGALTHVRASLPGDELSQPNFREGDSVVLYERNEEGEMMTNRQSLRCYIEELHPDHLLLRLAHPQHGATFLHAASRYAIEPGHSDALFNTMYRGLYALLACPEERRSLVLGKAETMADIRLLVGPPGSGKTSIALRRMVEEMLQQEPTGNILLTAYTNRAVDEICQMLEDITSRPAYLRIGQELSCSPQYRQRLVRNVVADCRNRKDVLRCIQPVQIFCGTVASLCGTPELFRLKSFHTAILDEASQVLEPQLMPLLTFTDTAGRPAIARFILVGDPMQLPAVVAQRTAQSSVRSTALRDIGLRDCRDSFFERLLRNAHGQADMLTRQGRMHEVISQFASQQYYDSRLQPVPLPHQTEPLAWAICEAQNERQTYVAMHRIGMRNVLPDPAETNNKTNVREADEVAHIVLELHRLSQLNNQPWSPRRGIGIIVPFRGQITTVRQALRRLCIPEWETITIDTVERYQGSQRDIIIFSTVVRQRYQLDILSMPVVVDGKSADRKLNVAVTRSRKQFFLVGNLALLRHAPDYASLIAYIESQDGQ